MKQGGSDRVEELEIVITHHSHEAGKWEYDYYGNKSIASDYGTTYYYQHAKFRFPPSVRYPKGKPKCIRFDDELTPEEVLALISKKYQPFKFKLSSSIINTSNQKQINK